MPRKTPRFRVHLTTVASSSLDFVERFASYAAMLNVVREGLGDDCRLTANRKLLTVTDDVTKGGRSDDAERAREVEHILADDTVDAMVTLRGGSWFCRVLNRINFDVLNKRKRRIVIYGFSEMTPLIAIAGQYPNVLALHDMGPAWLAEGLKTEALQQRTVPPIDRPEQRDGFAKGYAAARLDEAFRGFFQGVSSMLRDEPCDNVLKGRLLHGTLPPRKRIVVTGGNLSLVAPMLASRFAAAVESKGKWLALEEVGEGPHQIDRMLSGLSLNGLLDRADGILLGDFHDGNTDLRDTAYQILRRHLPSNTRKPIVSLDNFGHTWPIAPLAMHHPLTLRCTPKRKRCTLAMD